MALYYYLVDPENQRVLSLFKYGETLVRLGGGFYAVLDTAEETLPVGFPQWDYFTRAHWTWVDAAVIRLAVEEAPEEAAAWRHVLDWMAEGAVERVRLINDGYDVEMIYNAPGWTDTSLLKLLRGT